MHGKQMILIKLLDSEKITSSIELLIEAASHNEFKRYDKKCYRDNKKAAQEIMFGTRNANKHK